MLLDLAAKDFFQKLAGTQAKEIATLKSRIKADSLSRAGQVANCSELETEVKQLRTSNTEGWKMALYWQTRYQNANTERWIWRGLGAAGTGFGIKKIF